MVIVYGGGKGILENRMIVKVYLCNSDCINCKVNEENCRIFWLNIINYLLFKLGK